jgi:hypothetical protein
MEFPDPTLEFVTAPGIDHHVIGPAETCFPVELG